MVKRIITGLILTAFVVVLLLLSGTFIYPVVLSMISTMGVFEYLRAFGLVANWQLSAPAFLCSLSSPIVCYFVRDIRESVLWLFTILVLGYLAMSILNLFSKQEKAHTDTSVAFFGTTYVAVGFAAMAMLYNTSPGGGLWLIVPLVLAAWITDTFAYFTGVLIGKHKLCPVISPKKTVEGSLGGVVFAVLSFLLYGLILDLWFDFSPSYLLLAVSGGLLSVLSQLGDLIMSKVKRERQIKDFGTLLPGHGGVLDRFDSFLSTAPAQLLFTVATGGAILFS